ncbi:hypothetical protein BH23BAC4_BH23BAC4_09580 [soil metagenome]
MRHFIANFAVYLIAGVLVLAAYVWAVVRANQTVLANEEMVEPAEYLAATDLASFDWPEFGEAVYIRNCAACHGGNGQGREDYYPPLHNQDRVLAAEGGREYLINMVLYGIRTGLHGAPMPPMANLSDAKIAAVNNFVVTRFSHADPAELDLLIPADVALLRDLRLSEREVGRTRPDVPPPFELARTTRE